VIYNAVVTMLYEPTMFLTVSWLKIEVSVGIEFQNCINGVFIKTIFLQVQAKYD
jgi:hypothetical protein